MLQELGIKAVPLSEDAQCGEELTKDPLNGAFAGTFYYNPQTNAPACVFELGESGARPLGFARRHLQKDSYGCASFALEHHSGKRLAVWGLPIKITREVGEGKFFQLVALSDWVQHGASPVMPLTPHSQILIPLYESTTLKGVVVLNNTIEPVSLTLKLRTDSCATLIWNRPEHSSRPLSPVCSNSDNSLVVRIPKLLGWEIGFLSLVNQR